MYTAYDNGLTLILIIFLFFLLGMFQHQLSAPALSRWIFIKNIIKFLEKAISCGVFHQTFPFQYQLLRIS